MLCGITILSLVCITSFAAQEYIDLSQTTTGLVLGETSVISAVHVDSEGTGTTLDNSTLTYSVSNSDVISVSNAGVISPVSKGISRLTVTYGSNSTSLVIIVYDVIDNFVDFESGLYTEHGTLSTSFSRTGNNSELWDKDLNNVFSNTNYANLLSTRKQYQVNEFWLCDAPEYSAKNTRAYIRINDWNGNVIDIVYEQSSNNISFPASNVANSKISVPQRPGWRQFIVDTSRPGEIDVYMDGVLYFSATGNGSDGSPYGEFRRFGYFDSWVDSTSANVYVDDIYQYSLGQQSVIPKESLTIKPGKPTATIDGNMTLVPVLLPVNTTESIGAVVWESQNTAVATVTGGVVTGISKGTAKITAETSSMTAEYTVKITDKIIPYFSISNTDTSYIVGGTGAVMAEMVSETDSSSPISSSSLTFSVSNPDIISVSSEGEITALAIGISRLTVTYGEYSESLIISVYNTRSFYDSFESSKNSANGVLSTTFARTGTNSELWNKELNSVYLNVNNLNMLSSNTANFLIGEIWVCDAPELSDKFARANLRFTDWAGNNVNVLYEQGTKNMIFPASNVTGATITVPQRPGWRQFIVDTSTPGKIDIYMDGVLYFSATGVGSNGATYNNFRRFAYTDPWSDSTSINVYVDDVGLYSLGQSSVIPAEQIILTPISANIMAGTTADFTASILPVNSTSTVSSIIWETSNPLVATVGNGVVTGVAKGTAVITASLGYVQASANVEVANSVSPLISYENGKLSVNIINVSGEQISPYVVIAGYNSSGNRLEGVLYLGQRTIENNTTDTFDLNIDLQQGMAKIMLLESMTSMKPIAEYDEAVID